MSKLELAYHLPSIGSARITLHNESASLYRFLEDAQEIERLKRLDHLGLVREVWDGAHHPRWEYAVSILNLIEHCKQAPEVHLAGPVQLPGTQVEISSGSELLKAWVLLLNVGHLVWTFASERALLLELRPRTKARTSFLSSFGSGDLRAWAERVLDAADVYRFFQTIAYIRLGQLARNNQSPEMSAWQEMLRAYVTGDNTSQRVTYLRRVYRSLRRIAYLALDTHYTPSVVNVNLAQLLSDPAALSSMALRTIEDEFDELGALEAQLTREVYLSERVLLAIASRERSLRGWIKESLNDAGVESTLSSLANGTFRNSVAVETIHTVCRLPAWVSSPFDQLLLPALSLREEQQASERDLHVRNPDSRALWWAAPSGRQWVLQTFAPEALDSEQASFDFAFHEVTRVHEQATERARGFGEALFQRALFGQFGTELVEAALRLVFTRAVRWEWDVTPGEVAAWFTTRQGAERLLVSAQSDAPSDRADELDATRAALPGGSSTYLALNAVRLTAYEPVGSTHLGELDGVIIASDNVGEMSVTLVEAKRQRSGARAAARHQQNQLTKALKLRGGVDRQASGEEQTGSLAYAWLTLTASAWAPLPKPLQ